MNEISRHLTHEMSSRSLISNFSHMSWDEFEWSQKHFMLSSTLPSVLRIQEKKKPATEKPCLLLSTSDWLSIYILITWLGSLFFSLNLRRWREKSVCICKFVHSSLTPCLLHHASLPIPIPISISICFYQISSHNSTFFILFHLIFYSLWHMNSPFHYISHSPLYHPQPFCYDAHINGLHFFQKKVLKRVKMITKWKKTLLLTILRRCCLKNMTKMG